MITVEELRKHDPRDLAHNLALTSWALVRTARLALENENATALEKNPVSICLQVAEELLGVLDEATDFLHRETKRGIWAEKPSQPSGGSDGGSESHASEIY